MVKVVHPVGQAGEACAIGGVCRLRTIMDEAQRTLLDRCGLAHVAGRTSTALRRRLGVLSSQSILPPMRPRKTIAGPGSRRAITAAARPQTCSEAMSITKR